MKNFQYILMILVGGVMYGTMSSFVKLSYGKGFNAAELAFSQALLAAIILGAYTAFSLPKVKITTLSINNLFLLLLSGGTIGLTNYLYYQSVSYISASLAIILLMQFTWFSLLLEWLFFHKRPSKLELIIIFFILCGTVMAGDLLHEKAASYSLKGILLVLTASLTYAMYIVANGRVGVNIHWQLRSTLLMMGSAITIFIVNYRTITTQNHFGYDFLPWAIFLAVVGTTIPTALFASSIPKVGASISAILMTVELPVAILCAHVILHEHINYLQIIGIIVMLIAIATMNFFKFRLFNHAKPNNHKH